ncbi:5-formyltetrahydrofolate cyclo-ligase [Halomonas cupida]|uniref:5-formyltetrahydrofolate cyclo-ligase n=1 Tax=Halomonas cupida TaxID=44933 RepID=A0A1M7GKH5_9GAMM|nr:5-formyltetrahydrofolate cyclo-ligase [Halomonas cupida]GEN23840.1 5-formyltetrahydrofolate cyclo-ligase [Halomonas cupida]SHM16676.1 5-formyltetrahydrofolate cyclo-ligase [Halomonas cupida]
MSNTCASGEIGITDTTLTRAQLRRLLRQRRRQLSPGEQRQASQRLCRQLRGLPEMLSARHVALYLPNDGEIDPVPLLDWLRQRNANAYLPVLRPLADNALWFVRYDARTPMIRNRFGIPEPDSRFGALRARRMPTWALDVILLPLVGFDDQGQRIGMGGGFYDRTLAFTHPQNGPSRPRPRLIGLAHEVQHVESLPVASWDVPLDAIVSDERVIRARR